MPRKLLILIGIVAVTAPGLHLATDLLEWLNDGFSAGQLWLNYLAFALMPFLVTGLYASQLPTIRSSGLLGAVLYGATFVYFAHTTLYALVENVRTYEDLLNQLGTVYTVHGGLMVLGGLLFGVAVFRAGLLPRWTALIFLAGIVLNLAVALTPVPAMFQTLGSTLRNLGLMGMGFALLLSGPDPGAQD